MRRLRQPAWLVVCLCVGSLLSAAASTGAVSRPKQHVISWKKHASVATAAVRAAGAASSGEEGQLVIGVAMPPSGQPLMPECVPKFVTELVLPQPMPVNSAKRKQGPGCFDFSSIQLEDCSPYGSEQPPKQQQPGGYQGGDPEDPKSDKYRQPQQPDQPGNKTDGNKDDYNPYMRDPAVEKKVEDINKVLYPKAGSNQQQQQQQYGQQPPPGQQQHGQQQQPPAGQQPQEQPYGKQPQPPPYGQQPGSGQDKAKQEEQPPPSQQQYKQQHYKQQYDGTKRGVYRIPKEDGPTQTKERLQRYEQYIRKEFEKYKPRDRDGASYVPLFEDAWDDLALGSRSSSSSSRDPEGTRYWLDMFDDGYQKVVPHREVTAEDILLLGSEVHVAAVDGSRYPQLGSQKAGAPRSPGLASKKTGGEEGEEEEGEEEEREEEAQQAEGIGKPVDEQEEEEGVQSEEEEVEGSPGDASYGKSEKGEEQEEEQEEEGEEEQEEVPYSDKDHVVDAPAEEEEEPYQEAPHKGEQDKPYTPGGGQQQPPQAPHQPPQQQQQEKQYGAPPGDKPKGCPSPTAFRDYQISVKRVKQDVLPVGHSPLKATSPDVTCPAAFKQTPVFAYGPQGTKGQHSWPAHTIEAERYVPNRVTWINGLTDSEGSYIPHILNYAVDQTLTWANPQALGGSTDSSPCGACSSKKGGCAADQHCARAARETYDGPVPIVTHVHGLLGVAGHSEGYPEAWFLPDDDDIPSNYHTGGTWFKAFEHAYKADTCQSYKPGSATHLYTNTQQPSTAVFQDHTLGVTRLNVYAGMTGLYQIRKFFPTFTPTDTGPELPGLPYPPPGGAVDPTDVRELPLVIQDRVFQDSSKLWYPAADTPASLAYPEGSQPPLWIPKVLFSNDGSNPTMMTVNGRTWPKKTLAPDTYRLRLLNGCNSRVLQLRFGRTSAGVKDLGNANTNAKHYAPLPLWLVGNEAGFFPQLQGPITSLTLGPAERYDVILDLSAMTPSDYVYVLNTGPESPYDGTNTGETNAHTSQLMRLEFSAPSSSRPVSTFNFNYERQAALNAALLEGASPDLPPSSIGAVRKMALVEEPNPADGSLVRAVLLATADAQNTAEQQHWEDGPHTATPTDTVGEWDVINLTGDAQPLHLHGVVYQVVERTRISVPSAKAAYPSHPGFVDSGVPVSSPDLDPLLWISCPTSLNPAGRCLARRDTSMLLPGTRTRIRLRTGTQPALSVWHSHNLEHQDNAAMVPWCVGQPSTTHLEHPSGPFCKQAPSSPAYPATKTHH